MAVAVGNTYATTIISVTDGDTLQLRFPDGVTRSCRLFGVDTPESVYASSQYPTVWTLLPPSLQTQQFGSEATTRFSTILIGNTGAPTPVGLTVNATVRDTDRYGRTVVTIANDIGQDAGQQLLVTGHAVVWAMYAQAIPSIYSTYQTAEATARDADLVMWSTTTVYYPWDYRDDVDEAAKRLLYIIVDDTQPELNATDAYIDDDIIITFSREIEGSYISGNYFKLYRTNSGQTEFEATGASVSQSGLIVTVNPTSNLTANQYYMLVVVGGASGIEAIDSYNMEANYVLNFQTGNFVRPAPVTSGEVVTIDSVELWVDADHRDDGVLPSTDLFSTEGGPITLVSTVPANHTAGVYGLSRISFIYNDTLAVGLPLGALVGRYNSLPLDPDPLGDRSIFISGVVTEQNMSVFEIEYLDSDDTLNKEYTFTLAGGVAKGVNRTGYDNETHTIKFLGKLTPLYATPEQIKLRLSAWHSDMDSDILDYDLYKLILEKSMWTDENYGGAPTTTAALLARNKLVICMVLRDMMAQGAMLEGGVKSRLLLMTQVEYYNLNFANIITDLDKCIKDALAADETMGVSATIQIGIKSGAHLSSRQGKNYEVYR